MLRPVGYGPAQPNDRGPVTGVGTKVQSYRVATNWLFPPGQYRRIFGLTDGLPRRWAADHDKAHPPQGGAAKQPGLFEPAELPKEGGGKWLQEDRHVAVTAHGLSRRSCRAEKGRRTPFFVSLSGDSWEWSCCWRP
jgi:hypothetical protein